MLNGLSDTLRRFKVAALLDAVQAEPCTLRLTGGFCLDEMLSCEYELWC